MVAIRRSVLRLGITSTATDVTIYTLPVGKRFAPGVLMVNNGAGGPCKLEFWDGPSATGVLKYVIFAAAASTSTEINATELVGVDFGDTITIKNSVQPIDVFIGGFEE